MISEDNIPESILIGSTGMTVIEIKNVKAYNLIAVALSGMIFHTEKDGRYYVKATKSVIEEIKSKFNPK
jgi:hypothetical protein